MTDVSALTPSLNQGRFIEDNILSLLGQEGLLIQHIVQDGGSTDETLDVLRRFDDVIEWISEPDRGQSDALNKALSRATGRWIAWHNADDFYLPGALAVLVRHGDEVGADVVYGEGISVDVDGRIRRSMGHHRFKNRVSRSTLFYAAVLHSPSTIVRRSAIPPDPWDTAFRRIMDQEFFLKLASHGARFSFVKHPVGASRSHPETMTDRSDPMDFLDEYETNRKRYGIPGGGPVLGKALHRARKLVTGAYWRQLKAERLRGHDLRWFRSDEGQASFDKLLRACYGKSQR